MMPLKLVIELSGKVVVEVLTAGREALKNFGGGGGCGPAIAVSGGGGGQGSQEGREGRGRRGKKRRIRMLRLWSKSLLSHAISFVFFRVWCQMCHFLLHDTVCESGVRCDSEDLFFCPQEMDVDLFG